MRLKYHIYLFTNSCYDIFSVCCDRGMAEKGKNGSFFQCIGPPPANVNVCISELSQMCDQLYCESDNIILIGDMNINMQGKVSELHDLCDLYNLKNIVKEPTCFKSQDNPSLIEVILVAKPRHLHETVVFDTGLSDFHNIICVCTKVYVPWEVPTKIVYRSFKSFDENKYIEDISIIPFHVLYIFDDTDDVVWCHNKLLSDVVDIHAPLKQRILKKDSVPYMNSKLRKVQYRRNQLRNRYWDSKNSLNWEAYGKMSNKANVTKRQSEKVYFKGKCLENGNQKDFWKTF